MSATTPTVQPDDDSILTPDVEPAALEPKSEEPDAGKLGNLLGENADVRHVALVGLFILALFYTLNVAKSLFLPIVLAVLLDFLLSPVVRALRKIGIPEPVSAGLIVLGLVGVLVLGAYRLSEPAASWVARAPESIATVQRKLETVRRPVEKVSQAAAQVERATAVDKTPEVTVRGPSWSQQLFGGTAALIGAATIIVFLTYFLLAVGDLFLQKLVTVLPQFKDKKTAVKIARETESHISMYLFTTTLINIGVGVVTAVAMHLVGMPSPVLWGVVAGVLNFVPYVGAVVNTVILGLAAFVTFEDTGRALLVPAVFTAINLLEGNLITPMILGRRMRLNTVALFIGLVFWWYIWGVPGAILAVPMMAALKIACDNIESLAPIGEFLGR